MLKLTTWLHWARGAHSSAVELLRYSPSILTALCSQHRQTALGSRTHVPAAVLCLWMRVSLPTLAAPVCPSPLFSLVLLLGSLSPMCHLLCFPWSPPQGTSRRWGSFWCPCKNDQPLQTPHPWPQPCTVRHSEAQYSTVYPPASPRRRGLLVLIVGRPDDFPAPRKDPNDTRSSFEFV